MTKNNYPNKFYSLRSIFISGVVFSLILSGSIFSLAVWDLFRHHYHAPFIFTTTELVFSIVCCLISYPLAVGLVFYLKDFFQKFAVPWLVVSFLGSIIFSLFLVICDYVNTIIEIKNYKQPSFWLSGDFGPSELPTSEELILFVLITSIASFINTSLIYSLFGHFYDWLPTNKNKH